MTANEALQMLRGTAYCPSTIQLVFSEAEAMEITLRDIVFPDEDDGAMLEIDPRMVYVDRVRGGRHSATNDCQCIRLSRAVLSAGTFSRDQADIVRFMPNGTMIFHDFQVKSIVFTPKK